MAQRSNNSSTNIVVIDGAAWYRAPGVDWGPWQPSG